MISAKPRPALPNSQKNVKFTIMAETLNHNPPAHSSPEKRDSMLKTVLNLYRVLFEEQEPAKLHRLFLETLLKIQNVERGSLWVKKREEYICMEAIGKDAEAVMGVSIPAERPSIVGWVIDNGEMTIAEAGKDSRHYSEMEEKVEEKSTLILSFPLILKSGEVYGCVQIIDTSAEGDRLNLDESFLDLLQAQIAVCSIALSHSLSYKDQLRENVRLKRKLKEISGRDSIVGNSPAMQATMASVRNYARTDFPVLITGESGTGKELIAHEIHRQSNRSQQPFLVQNCSAIPETLLESELFGYKKGAFTGATRDKVGLFEAADGGTVFLDEIGDMPLALQARILRIIQNSEIKPLGGTASKKVDVRILSATNKELQQAIQDKEFREDLFYRLNVLPLNLPPLRKRREDIPMLLRYFLGRESKRLGVAPRRLTGNAMNRLASYPWTGNIREMENLIKYLLTTADTEEISETDLPLNFLSTEVEQGAPDVAPEPTPMNVPSANLPLATYTWEGLERAYVMALLEHNKWNISRAARQAQVNRSTFDSRMKRLGITKD